MFRAIRGPQSLLKHGYNLSPQEMESSFLFLGIQTKGTLFPQKEIPYQQGRQPRFCFQMDFQLGICISFTTPTLQGSEYMPSH